MLLNRAAALGVALVATVLLVRPALADGWVDNVNGITLDAAGSIVRFAGLTVTADGKVGKLLMRGAKPPPRPDWRLDGKGRTLLPGMIDAHAHIIALGFSALPRAPGKRDDAAPLSKDRDLALAKAQDMLLAFGVTAIADMATGVDDWNSFRRAGDGGRLAIRIFAYSDGLAPMLAIAGGEPTPWLYGDRLRMAGVGFAADGALVPRAACLKRPSFDAPGQNGRCQFDDAKLRNSMSRAAMDGFQVAVDAIGDRADVQLLDAIDELALTYKGDRRWRIENAEVIDAADLPRFGRNGIITTIQPVHAAFAWTSLLSNGAHLAFGSDAPVESANPFAALAAAIPREAALAAVTTGAAYASFAEDRVGRLAPGYRADFILVDGDPLLGTPAELRAMVVQETWIGGVRVFRRK